MYDEEGFQISNEIDRYAIGEGDRDPLAYNADRSLDIYISSINPGQEREANWLPRNPERSAPCSASKPQTPGILDGLWRPPAVQR